MLVPPNCLINVVFPRQEARLREDGSGSLGSTSLATGIMSLIDLFRFKRRWYSDKKEDLRCGEPSRQKAAGFPSLADGKRLFSGSRQGADGVMEVPELFLRLCMMLNVSRGTNLQNLIFDILKK